MATCRTHPEIEATATCAACGADLCQECVAPGEGVTLCVDCSIAEAGERADRTAPAAAMAAPAERPRRRASTAFVIIVVGGLVVAAAELAILLLVPGTPTSTRAPSGLEPEQAKTAVSVAEVGLVRAGVEEYREQHGRYPETLSEILPELPDSLRDKVSGTGLSYVSQGASGFSLRLEDRGQPPVVFSSTDGVVAPELEEVQP